ncbi:MAG: MFS transporter [Lachnospiraceae bacterium]
MMKRAQLKFMVYYFCFFAGLSCILSYINVYLEKVQGFTGTQLGIYTSLTGLFPAFLIPAVGYLADKTGRHSLFLSAALGVQITCLALLPLQKYAAVIIIFGIMAEVARLSIMSLADTRATEFCAETKNNYGILRGTGSFGWLLFGILTGIIVEYSGSWSSIFPLACGITLPAFFAALTFPKKKKTVSSASFISLHDVKLLLKSRSYLLIILLSIQATVTTDTILSYIGNHLAVTLNAGASSISLHTVFCIIPEIITLPLASHFLPKLGHRKCYLISCICLIVRFFIYAAAPNAGLFMLGSLFQGITLCCFTVVNLSFLKKTVMPSLFNTAVTLSLSASALGRALLAFLFGQLYEYAGSYSIFWFVLILQIPITLIVWRTKLLD